MKTVVYLDILLLVNWIIDYFLLLGATALASLRATRLRLAVAAGLGAASTLVFLAPPLSFLLQMVYRIVSGALVVLAAFAPIRPRFLLKGFLWYLLLNFCYAGLVLAAIYYFSLTGVEHRNAVFYYNISPVMLFACIFGMYLFLRLLLLLFEKPCPEQCHMVTVQLGAESLQVDVLLDTGFSATDILLGQPLLLVSATAVGGRQPQLKKRLTDYFACGCLPGVGWRLLPVHTVTGEALLPAVTARVVMDGSAINVTVAFCREMLRGGNVQGLIGPDFCPSLKMGRRVSLAKVFHKKDGREGKPCLHG